MYFKLQTLTLHRPESLKKAALIGYYGVGNLGDELMLMCLHRILSRDFDLTVIAENAEEVRTRWGFRAVQSYPLLGQFAWAESLLRGKAFRILKEIVASDVVICGGGEILRDSLGWRTFSYQIEKLALAILLRKRVFLLNVGIPRPTTSYARKALRWLLPRCAGIVVRESTSLSICREYGAAAHTSFQPDIVVHLPDFFPPARNGTMGPSSVLVALHANPNVYGGFAMNEGRISSLAAGLDLLIEKHGLTVNFLPCQSDRNTDDNQIHLEVQSRMRHKHATVMMKWTADPEQLSRHYRSAEVVVAMRLHAAVLAVAYDRPCVLLPYDKKVRDFGTQFHIPYRLTAEELDNTNRVESVLNSAVTEKCRAAFSASNAGWLSTNFEGLATGSADGILKTPCSPLV